MADPSAGETGSADSGPIDPTSEERMVRCLQERRELRPAEPLEPSGRAVLRYRCEGAPALVPLTLRSLGWERWCPGDDARDWNIMWKCSRYR